MILTASGFWYNMSVNFRHPTLGTMFGGDLLGEWICRRRGYVAGSDLGHPLLALVVSVAIYRLNIRDRRHAR
jgi:hypothetical protein